MSTVQAATLPGVQSHKAGHFIPVGAGVHHDIQDFLFREAYLLDHERYVEWMGMLSEDLVYRTAAHVPQAIKEDYHSIRARIGHLPQSTATSSPDLPRRFITNVIVSVARCCDEYDVVSYLLIARNRGADMERLLSAERHDRLRRSSQSYRLVQREIVVDTSARSLPAFL